MPGTNLHQMNTITGESTLHQLVCLAFPCFFCLTAVHNFVSIFLHNSSSLSFFSFSLSPTPYFKPKVDCFLFFFFFFLVWCFCCGGVFVPFKGKTRPWELGSLVPMVLPARSRLPVVGGGCPRAHSVNGGPFPPSRPCPCVTLEHHGRCHS